MTIVDTDYNYLGFGGWWSAASYRWVIESHNSVKQHKKSNTINSVGILARIINLNRSRSCWVIQTKDWSRVNNRPHDTQQEPNCSGCLFFFFLKQIRWRCIYYNIWNRKYCLKIMWLLLMHKQQWDYKTSESLKTTFNEVTNIQFYHKAIKNTDTNIHTYLHILYIYACILILYICVHVYMHKCMYTYSDI